MIVFTCGGFHIETPENKVYLYRSEGNEKFHIIGPMAEEIGLTSGKMMHIFFESTSPNFLYFCPFKDGDSYFAGGKSGCTLTGCGYMRVSCQNRETFEKLNIPSGIPKQTDAKHSGHHLTPTIEVIMGRKCLRVDLHDIPNWKAPNT